MPQPAVIIQSQNLPGFPGTIAYQIVGDNAETVQNEINRLFRQVERFDGCAEFHNPARTVDGKYISTGYTFVQSMNPLEV